MPYASDTTIEGRQRAVLPHKHIGGNNIYILRNITAFLHERDGHENLYHRQEQAALQKANRAQREPQYV